MDAAAINNRILSRKVFYALLFTVFIFTYMEVLSVIDRFAGTVPELADGIFLHYLPAITRIIGYLSFFLSRKYITTEKNRRLVLMTASLLFLASALILIGFSDATALQLPGEAMIVSLFTLSLSIGHLGGLVYYLTSSATVTESRRGIFIGCSCAAAVLIQFVLSPFMGGVTQLVAVTVLFVLISYLEIKPPADYVLEDALPYAGDDPAFISGVKWQLGMAMLIVLLGTILACRIDVAFSSMSFSGDLNLYSFPRLFIIPGYLIMGFAADAKDRRLFPAVFFVGILSSVTLIVMPFYDSGYYFFLSAYYFFIGFYVFYYTYSFMSLAPRTKHPELWASFGRPVSDFFTGVFIMLLLSTKGWAMTPIITVVAHFALLAAMGIVIMLGRVDPAVTPEETEDRLKVFLDRYPLTPREREVARYLIETEAPMKEIAADLAISERSVYRYSASIYEKTGSVGRNELLRQYLE